MKKLEYESILERVRAGNFCDCGHYHCPVVREDGAIIFAAGKVDPQGNFEGAQRLLHDLRRECGRPVYVRRAGDMSDPPEGCPMQH